MDDRKVFLFRFFPLGLEAQLNFLTFCKDKHAGGPLVEAMDGEDAVTRLQAAFADIIGQEVVSGPCFVSLRCD